MTQEQQNSLIEDKIISELERKVMEHDRTACACMGQPMMKMLHEATRDAYLAAIEIVRDYKQ